MKPIIPGKSPKTTSVEQESRFAWELWKKINAFSDYLWNAYEYDFLTLAASEPPPEKIPDDDGLPF